MADVIVKNASGEDVTYEGVTAVELDNTDGGTAVFHSEDSLTADKIAVSNSNVEATDVDAAITELAGKMSSGGGASDASDVTYTPSDDSGFSTDKTTVEAILNSLDSSFSGKYGSKSNQNTLMKMLYAFSTGVSSLAGTELKEATTSASIVVSDTMTAYRVTNAETWVDSEGASHEVPAGCIWLAETSYNNGTPFPLVGVSLDGGLGQVLFGSVVFEALLGGAIQKGGIPANSVVLNPNIYGYWNAYTALASLLSRVSALESGSGSGSGSSSGSTTSGDCTAATAAFCATVQSAIVSNVPFGALLQMMIFEDIETATVDEQFEVQMMIKQMCKPVRFATAAAFNEWIAAGDTGGATVARVMEACAMVFDDNGNMILQSYKPPFEVTNTEGVLTAVNQSDIVSGSTYYLRYKGIIATHQYTVTLSVGNQGQIVPGEIDGADTIDIYDSDGNLIYAGLSNGASLSSTNIVQGNTYTLKYYGTFSAQVIATADGVIDVNAEANAEALAAITSAEATVAAIETTVSSVVNSAFYIPAGDLFINFDGMLPSRLFALEILLQIESMINSIMSQAPMTADEIMNTFSNMSMYFILFRICDMVVLNDYGNSGELLAENVAFDVSSHPELAAVLPSNPTMQDALVYLMTQNGGTAE